MTGNLFQGGLCFEGATRSFRGARPPAGPSVIRPLLIKGARFYYLYKKAMLSQGNRAMPL